MGIRNFNYVSGGAGERATMDANRLAFRQWKVFRSFAYAIIKMLIGCKKNKDYSPHAQTDNDP